MVRIIRSLRINDNFDNEYIVYSNKVNTTDDSYEDRNNLIISDTFGEGTQKTIDNSNILKIGYINMYQRPVLDSDSFRIII